MHAIPKNCNDLGPEASLLFLNLHLDAAVKVFKAGAISASGESIANHGPLAC